MGFFWLAAKFNFSDTLARPHANNRTETKSTDRATRSDHSQEAAQSSRKSVTSLTRKMASFITVRAAAALEPRGGPWKFDQKIQ